MIKLRKDIEQVLLTGNSTSWDWRKGRGVMLGFVLYVTFSHIILFTIKAICEISLPQILQLHRRSQRKKKENPQLRGKERQVLPKASEEPRFLIRCTLGGGWGVGDGQGAVFSSSPINVRWVPFQPKVPWLHHGKYTFTSSVGAIILKFICGKS